MNVRELIAAGGVGSRFQPIVQLSDGSVVAHEALSRGPAGSALECPRLLYGAAEAEGCALELDAACRALALQCATESGWTAGTNGPLFLNVWPGALSRPAFLPELTAALAAVGRGPRDVVLEVNEAEHLDAHLDGPLAECRAAGFWIALDDAGAGRCGLRAIVEVVPDVVKVDRALVGGIDQHRGRRAAVAALARLARDLGIVLVAEGIETQGELRAVRDLGVPLGQGFLLGRPAPNPLVGRAAAFVAAAPGHTPSPVRLAAPAGAAVRPGRRSRPSPPRARTL